MSPPWIYNEAESAEVLEGELIVSPSVINRQAESAASVSRCRLLPPFQSTPPDQVSPSGGCGGGKSSGPAFLFHLPIGTSPI